MVRLSLTVDKRGQRRGGERQDLRRRILSAGGARAIDSARFRTETGEKERPRAPFRGLQRVHVRDVATKRAGEDARRTTGGVSVLVN